MRAVLEAVTRKLKVPLRLWALYVVIYGLWGAGMNALGTYWEIARFASEWQVLSVYILFMVPVSLLVRGLPWFRQYAYGLVSMGLLEFGGYALQTSYAYPDNILDQLFGIRNFSLAMSLFFALYFPLGNALVSALFQRLFPAGKS
jgi:hypothetical protein